MPVVWRVRQDAAPSGGQGLEPVRDNVPTLQRMGEGVPMIGYVELAPVDFPESNAIFKAPPGHEDEIPQIDAFVDDEEVITCWRMPLLARISVLLGGNVWLRVMGNSMAPMALGVQRGRPFRVVPEPTVPEPER